MYFNYQQIMMTKKYKKNNIRKRKNIENKVNFVYCCGFLSTKGKTRKTLTKLEVHDYTVKLNIANSAICGILIAPNERFGVKQY